MPLTAKGEEIRKHLEQEYGAKKGEQILYAGKNKGTFTGIDADETKGEQSSEDARMSAIEGRLSEVESKNDAAFEKDLKDNEPRVVVGIKGAKSKDFRKKFPNQKAMERWFESEEAGDVSVQYVKRADAEDVFDSIPAGLDPAKLDAACSMMDSLNKRCDEFFSRKDATRRSDAAFERDLKDNEPRVVIGIKGAKSKDFRKKFPNQKAMEKWFESEEAGDVSVQYVQRA